MECLNNVDVVRRASSSESDVECHDHFMVSIQDWIQVALLAVG